MSESMILTYAYLKETMSDAMVYRKELITTDNLDNILTAGTYICNKPSGLPASVFKYGALRVSYSLSRIVQEYFPDKKASEELLGIPIWRIKVGSAWGDWQTYSGETIT